MPVLNIGGREVRVGDEFLQKTPEQQNAIVQDIARQMGIGKESVPAPQPAVVPQVSTTIPAMLSGMDNPAQPAVNQGADAPVYVAQRGSRGIADFVGAPVDLATMGLNTLAFGADKLGEFTGLRDLSRKVADATGIEALRPKQDRYIEKPVLGSDWIAEKAAAVNDALGGTLVPEEAVSPGVRVLGDAVEFGVGAAAGGGSLASSTARKVAQESAPLVQRFARPLVAPYKETRGAVVGDTVAGFGAGAASGVYDEYVPDTVKDFLGPFGPIAAALAGGTTGAGVHAATKGTVDAAKTVAKDVVLGKGDEHTPFDPATGKREFSRAEMDEAARSVQEQASNPTAAAKTLGEVLASLAPDMTPSQMPTSGAASNDVGLALLEREARARNPRPFLERDQAVNARAGDIVRNVAPDGSSARDFTDMSDALQRTRETAARSGVDTARAAERNFDLARMRDAAPVVAGAGQKVSASQELDASITDQSLRPMQARKNEAFGAIDPDRSVTRDAAPLMEAAQAIRDSLGRLNDPASVLPTRTLDRIAALAVERGGDGTIAFGELNTLRPELSSALTKARAVGDFALADNIQALQFAIHRETDRLAAEATPAGARAAEAQRIYAQEFAPVWNVGPGDEATRFRRDVNADRQARTQSPPSATAGRFLAPGQPEKAASLQRIIATLPDPAAVQAEARRFLVSDLAESGVVDPGAGHLRPDALRRWSNRWGDTLATVPGMRDEVAGLLRRADADELQAGRLAVEVRRAEQQLDETIRNKGALGLVLGKDPINAVESVFNAGDPQKAMQDVLDQLGTNRRAREGLQAAVVDYVTDRTTQAALQRTVDGSRPIDFARLENLFDRHAKTLSTVFAPAQMNALRQAHKLLKPGNALKQAGKSGAVYETGKAENAWRLLEGGLKAKFGILKGGGVLRTIRIFAETLPNSDEAVQNIIVRMHFYPELAQHLLTRPVKDVNTPLWNKRLNRLLAVAAGARENVRGDDSERKPLELTITEPAGVQ